MASENPVSASQSRLVLSRWPQGHYPCMCPKREQQDVSRQAALEIVCSAINDLRTETMEERVVKANLYDHVRLNFDRLAEGPIHLPDGTTFRVEAAA